MFEGLKRAMFGAEPTKPVYIPVQDRFRVLLAPDSQLRNARITLTNGASVNLEGVYSIREANAGFLTFVGKKVVHIRKDFVVTVTQHD